MQEELLKAQLIGIERQYSGALALDVRRLDRPGRFSLREHESLPTASTCKLFVLCELLRQAEAGIIDLDAPIVARPEFWCGGDGVLRAMKLGQTLSIHNMAVLMIIISDNVATAALVDLLGAENVARMVRGLGLGEKNLVEGLSQWVRPGAVEPESTAHDLCSLIARIYRHEILTSDSCDEILRIMRAQRCNDMLGRHIPVGQDWGDAEQWIASKTGYGRCTVEVGMVHTRDMTFSLAVFFKPNAPIEPQFKCLADHPPVLAVAAACRAVYESMLR